MLRPNLPWINDMEGATVPADLPEVVDAHVHIFPQGIFSLPILSLSNMHISPG